MTYTLTDEQDAICTAVQRAEKSLMISALAGTGKTSTIEAAAQRVKEPALATAFNKKIADELSGRLPGNFASKTLNGLGFGAWIRSLNGAKPNVDKDKLRKIIRSVASEINTYLTNEQQDDCYAAVTAVMQAGLSYQNQGSPMVEDTEENWKSLIDVSPMDFDLIYDIGRQTLERSINTARTGYISFDDQIYCPTILGGRFAQYPRVFIDEAQDLSPLNHKMLSLCIRDGGLVTVVGDPRQAIYAFRGADAQSMAKMKALHPSWQDLSLTLTFRCPKAVVARQQAHAPGYRAHDNNFDGAVLTAPIDDDTGLPSWSWDTIKGELGKLPTKLIPSVGPAAAIICRNNAPLISLAFKLIRQGIGCQMAGGDIGRGLVAFTRRIPKMKDDDIPIVKFALAMSEWVERECQLAEANHKPERAERLRDQHACIIATMEGASPSTSGDLRLGLKQLFDKSNMPVILSSGHRSKGLEWPLVVHLDPWRIPSKQSQMANLFGDPRPLEQEWNLQYVTETRTKHTLINADLETFH